MIKDKIDERSEKRRLGYINTKTLVVPTSTDLHSDPHLPQSHFITKNSVDIHDSVRYPNLHAVQQCQPIHANQLIICELEPRANLLHLFVGYPFMLWGLDGVIS